MKAKWMVMMMPRRLSPKPNLPTPPLTDQQQVFELEDIWKDTGLVHYLLDTLKLTYVGKYGRVTLENIKIEQVDDVLRSLRNDDSEAFKRGCVTTVNAQITLSICGVTWQKKGDSLRIRALSEAALLRSLHRDFSGSQAVFKYERTRRDLATNSAAVIENGVHKYANVTVRQFLDRIQNINAQVPLNMSDNMPIKQENFYRLFSDHEQQSLARFGLNFG